MTLYWGETASDCEAVQYLTPYVLTHFARTPKHTWEFRDDSPRLVYTNRVNRNVERLLMDLTDFLPREPRWTRTHRRLHTLWSVQEIRRMIGDFVDRPDGDACLCGPRCRYPRAS